MKAQNITNLIKYHSEGNDAAFCNEAYSIAKYFDVNGDSEIADYILALISDKLAFTIQSFDDDEDEFTFIHKMNLNENHLLFPKIIFDDLTGIINAITNMAKVNKFLFQGAPGTGKTEAVKYIAKYLKRDLYVVDTTEVIDCKLGQTSKNISCLFKEIFSIKNPDNVIILFDEIDSLVLDRAITNDLREMGRATSTFIKELDNMNSNYVVFATTNLYKQFDKAIVRRFDFVTSFDRYSQDDLKAIFIQLVNSYVDQNNWFSKNNRLLKKMLANTDNLPYPGDLENIVKTSIAFSDFSNEFSYIKRLYKELYKCEEIDAKTLLGQKYTLREIEILTGISRSTISRKMRV